MGDFCLLIVFDSFVEDIDLFPAGLAEVAVPGGLLGPTFSCILANQFSNLKRGDRFWYESRDQPKPFTPGNETANSTIQSSLRGIF